MADANSEIKGIAFAEAIAFLKDRLKFSDADWQALIFEVDAAARARSSDMSEAMSRDILQAILAAMEEGSTIGDFEEKFDGIAAARGWSGDNEDGWRARLVFRTMTAQAQAAGRWRQIQAGKKHAPYLRYITAEDNRVRDAHAAWQGVILDAEDPWWKTHFPPNGFNCRCHVQQLSDDDLERYGWQVSEAAPWSPTIIKFVKIDGVLTPVEAPAGVDPGFAFNPGEIGLKLKGI